MLVYKATNVINKKSYIGITNNLSRRQDEHLRLATNQKSDYHFHRAIRKYGYENFQWDILSEIDTREKSGLNEKKMIKKYDTFKNGYNSTTGGDRAFQMSSESKRKQSDSMKGNTNGAGNKGKTVSTEARKNMSIAHIGYRPSKESTQKRADSNRGKKRTQEMKDRMSVAAKKLPMVICLHCGYEGRGNSMARWHLDKCRNKKCD